LAGCGRTKHRPQRRGHATLRGDFRFQGLKAKPQRLGKRKLVRQHLADCVQTETGITQAADQVETDKLVIGEYALTTLGPARRRE